MLVWREWFFTETGQILFILTYTAATLQPTEGHRGSWAFTGFLFVLRRRTSAGRKYLTGFICIIYAKEQLA